MFIVTCKARTFSVQHLNNINGSVGWGMGVMETSFPVFVGSISSGMYVRVCPGMDVLWMGEGTYLKDYFLMCVKRINLEDVH